MKIAGAILAGGKAKRLNGIAKGNIKINNKTIITNLLKAFAQAGISDVIISANDFKPYKQYQKKLLLLILKPIPVHWLVLVQY